LHEFSEDFYKSIRNIESELPKEIFHKFQKMCELRIFEKYQEIAGIESALHRIDLRFRRPVNLVGAISILEADYEIYQSEFSVFFRELQRHINQTGFIAC
jgi:acyl carrier protein phosphodiesterase